MTKTSFPVNFKMPEKVRKDLYSLFDTPSLWPHLKGEIVSHLILEFLSNRKKYECDSEIVILFFTENKEVFAPAKVTFSPELYETFLLYVKADCRDMQQEIMYALIKLSIFVKTYKIKAIVLNENKSLIFKK